ncbi:protein phosphatase [Streptomyces albus subsp. albus]|nr:protein phosphatase [Streptomyces albus subsp. albus]
MIGAHGVIERWGRGARALLGYRDADVVGRSVTALLADGGEGAPAVSDRRRVDDGWEALVSVRHRDGHPVELAVRACPLSAAPGAPSWLVVAAEAAGLREREQEQEVLRAAFTQSPFGMAVMDAQLRYLVINPAQERLDGVAAGQRLGRRPGEAIPGAGGAAIEREVQGVLEAGEPALTLEQIHAAPAGPDSPGHDGQVRSRSSFRLQDPAGRVVGVCQAVVDVTSHYRARERLALVNEASWRIGTTLNLYETARELADVLVPRVADFVSVDLLDAVVRAEELHPGPVGEREVLRRTAHRSIHTDVPEAVVQPGEPSHHARGSLPDRCLRTGQPILEASVDHDKAELTADAPRAAKVRELGIHSAMAVPLQARGITMGVVSLARWRNPEPFGGDDLLLVEELAARAAVCTDNARRFTREHSAALALQRSLLPHSAPRQSAVDVAYRYLPADAQAGVGGDWFDVIPLSGARVALVVGDVVGHGIHAAATMGRLRTAVLTLADLDLPPDELLAHLDDLVLRLSEEEESRSAGGNDAGVIGATCVYAIYDPTTRRATVARAGHPGPVISRVNDPVELPYVPAGPPLGLGGLPFECAELELEEGSVLAFFTDGLIEAGDRDIDTGFERLFFALAHPDRPLEEICDSMVRMLLPDRPHDDVAFLIARTRGLAGEDIATWDLPDDPAAVADARHMAGHQVTEWGLPEIAFTTELIVSELVTNAVRYGAPPVRLRLIRDRTLICEVSDGSNTSPHLRHARSTDEGGRGLFLVAQCTQHWGTRYTPQGKTIWTEQRLPPSADVAA